MKEYRAVRTIIFIYDCSRLLFLLSLISAFLFVNPAGPAGMFRGSPGIMGLSFPFLVYAAPNALFPLMSFFLMVRFELSKAYIPLYITGKLIVLSAAAVWFFFVLTRTKELPRTALPVFMMGAADLGSVLGMSLLGEAGLRQNAGALRAEDVGEGPLDRASGTVGQAGGE
ncbi:MAG: hypothetical protein LBQ44_04505 [Treponema sp.]|jgi:hypothetical protein|nr:hypothetical protein [Treponema sp.]